jgi:hypothetical protein
MQPGQGRKDAVHFDISAVYIPGFARTQKAAIEPQRPATGAAGTKPSQPQPKEQRVPTDQNARAVRKPAQRTEGRDAGH